MILDSILKNNKCYSALIQQKTKTFVNGQVSYIWSDVIESLPVFIFNSSTSIVNINERFKKDCTAVAMCRFREGKTVKSEMRLSCGSKTYDILYTDDLGMQNQVLYLFLKEVTG